MGIQVFFQWIRRITPLTIVAGGIAFVRNIDDRSRLMNLHLLTTEKLFKRSNALSNKLRVDCSSFCFSASAQ